jgi:hypothetical protein
VTSDEKSPTAKDAKDAKDSDIRAIFFPPSRLGVLGVKLFFFSLRVLGVLGGEALA